MSKKILAIIAIISTLGIAVAITNNGILSQPVYAKGATVGKQANCGAVGNFEDIDTEATNCHEVSTPSGHATTVIKGDTGTHSKKAQRDTDLPCGNEPVSDKTGDTGKLVASASGKVSLVCHF
jgi:hypothetical protein